MKELRVPTTRTASTSPNDAEGAPSSIAVPQQLNHSAYPSAGRPAVGMHPPQGTSSSQQPVGGSKKDQTGALSTHPPSHNVARNKSTASRIDEHSNNLDSAPPENPNEDAVAQNPTETLQDVQKRRPGRPKGSKNLTPAERMLSKFSPQKMPRSRQRTETKTSQSIPASQPVKQGLSSHLGDSPARGEQGGGDASFTEHSSPPLREHRSLPLFTSNSQPQQRHYGTAAMAQAGRTPVTTQHPIYAESQERDQSRISPSYRYPPLSNAASFTHPQRPTPSYRLISVLIEDKRFGFTEPDMTELTVPLHVADGGGYWVDAKDVCEPLQQGPSRIDGEYFYAHVQIQALMFIRRRFHIFLLV